MPQIAPKCPTYKITKKVIDLPPDAEGLTQEQRRAIQLLLMGKTVSEIAVTLGKDRKTIYRWRQNPRFIAELNRQQLEMQESVNLRLRGLAKKAVLVLERSLDQGNLRAAIELLKMSNVVTPAGDLLTDTELIGKRQAEKMAADEVGKMTYVKGYEGELAADIAEFIRSKYKITSEIAELTESV